MSKADYVAHVAPWSRRALEQVAGRVPRIHFGTGTGHLLEELAVGADAVGIDYRRARLHVFLISSAGLGVIGAFYAQFYGSISPAVKL